MPNNAKIILFGASKGGKNAQAFLKNKTVVAFADNDKAKWNTKINNVPVMNPADALKQNYDEVWVSSNQYMPIIGQLKKMGVSAKKIFTVSFGVLTGQISNNSKVVIFGAGNGGKRAYEGYWTNAKVVAFADNDSKKQNSKINNIPVMSPQNALKGGYDAVALGSTTYSQQIQNDVKKYGVKNCDNTCNNLMTQGYVIEKLVTA